MLKSRTLVTILHKPPISARATSPTISLRDILRKHPLGRSHQLSQRTSYSTRASNQLQTIRRPRWRSSIIRSTRNVRWQSNKPTQTAAQANGSQAPQSMSQRFKELSRRYGYAAVGVYLGLSVLDFPFCFLAVRLVGPGRVGELEHAVVDAFWSIIGILMPSMRPKDRTGNETMIEAEAREAGVPEKNGHPDNASIWTQLLLAYGVHKSLIFFRVPLTAAVTPKVVKTLRGWGWNIGRPTQRVKAGSAPPP